VQKNLLLSKNKSFENLYNKEFYNFLEKYYSLGVEFYSFKFIFAELEDSPKKNEILEIRKDQISRYIVDFSSEWVSKIPFVIFSYGVFQVHDEKALNKGFPYFEGILGVNSIIPNNGYNVYLNIKETLRGTWNMDTEVDLTVDYLSTRKDILLNLNGFTRNLDLNKHFFFIFMNKDSFNLLGRPLLDFFYFLKSHQIEIEGFWDEYFNTNTLSQYKFNKLIVLPKDDFLLFNKFIKSRVSSEIIFINFLNIFLQLEGYFFFNNFFYKKMGNTFFTYEKVYSLEYLLNNFEIILERLLREPSLKFHLEYTDINFLSIKYLSLGINILKNYPKFYIYNILVNIDILCFEYVNGLYFEKFECFLLFSNLFHKQVIDNLENKNKIYSFNFENKNYTDYDEKYNEVSIKKLVEFYSLFSLLK
jgi:hypothetical protein